MPELRDEEFGTIIIRRSAVARYVRIRVAPNGTLRASLPLRAPLYMVKRLIKQSRAELRELLRESNAGTTYDRSGQIGKSHSLIVQPTAKTPTTVERQGLLITVQLADGDDIKQSKIQAKIRPHVIAALRKEAKAHLPKRIAYLAEKHDFTYERLRFSHASSRWGSCSSTGTISLNIALMKLPFELIDYVLIHELCHTRHMNHSQAFWDLVAEFDPNFKANRRALTRETPNI